MRARVVLCAMTCLALMGCAAAKPAVVLDGLLVKEGYYRIAAPADWKELHALGKDTLQYTQVVTDAKFARCPETQTITIGRASYRQKRAMVGDAGDRELMTMAYSLVDEVHSSRRNPPLRSHITVATVTIGGLRAAEVTFDTVVLGGGFCDPTRWLGPMTERYLLVDAGPRGLGLSNHAGIWAQKFVLLHFESPQDAFDAGLPAFDRLATSLEFLER